MQRLSQALVPYRRPVSFLTATCAFPGLCTMLPLIIQPFTFVILRLKHCDAVARVDWGLGTSSFQTNNAFQSGFLGRLDSSFTRLSLFRAIRNTQALFHGLGYLP